MSDFVPVLDADTVKEALSSPVMDCDADREARVLLADSDTS